MFVRATRVQAPPGNLKAAIQNFKTNVIKGVRSTRGNQGAALLVNRQTGAGIGITYWESANALVASEKLGVHSRQQASVNVERAELVIMDRAAAPKAGSFVRVVTANGHPDKLDAAIVYIRNTVLAVLKAQKGYSATIASVDRQSGRLSASSVWDTKADLDASESKIAGPWAETAKIAGASSQDVQVEIFETVFVELSAAATPATARPEHNETPRPPPF